jgi:hypothetical protein
MLTTTAVLIECMFVLLDESASLELVHAPSADTHRVAESLYVP